MATGFSTRSGPDGYRLNFDTDNLDYYLLMQKIARHCVDGKPAADVAPVRHGRWIEEHGETFIPIEYDTNGELILHNYVGYHCSLCGRYEHVQEPYCNCGALMDGKVNRHEVSES